MFGGLNYSFSRCCFFRINNISVPCPHAQLRGRTGIKMLWTFFGLMGRDRSQSPPCWIFSGEANTSIHGLREDNTAIIGLPHPVIAGCISSLNVLI